jgi:hypothetical protein
MSVVNESVVREYFEMLGYLVSQPRKFTTPGRQKKVDEEVDFVIMNPTVPESQLPGHLVWTTPDLKHVGCAVVAVRGWHTERFYASTIEQTPDILRFVEPGPIRFAGKLLGTESVAKILCIPKLPASGDLKDKTIRLLKGRGIDGIISFATMLSELVGRVDKNKNYEKSDLLQILRILQSYDFFRDAQMEFFTGHHVEKRRRASKSQGEADV